MDFVVGGLRVAAVPTDPADLSCPVSVVIATLFSNVGGNGGPFPGGSACGGCEGEVTHVSLR